MTEDIFSTDAEAIEYLSRDGGGTPCSRYGRNGGECAPVAAAVARIIVRETSGGNAVTVDDLEHAMGLVVNDHPDPAMTLVQHGLEHGYDPRELLGNVLLENTILVDILYAYDAETRDTLAEVFGIDSEDRTAHGHLITRNTQTGLLTLASARDIATEWHGGQDSPLYALSSTGTVVPGVVREIASLANGKGVDVTDADYENLLELLEYCRANGDYDTEF